MYASVGTVVCYIKDILDIYGSIDIGIDISIYIDINIGIDMDTNIDTGIDTDMPMYLLHLQYVYQYAILCAMVLVIRGLLSQKFAF